MVSRDFHTVLLASRERKMPSLKYTRRSIGVSLMPTFLKCWLVGYLQKREFLSLAEEKVEASILREDRTVAHPEDFTQHQRHLSKLRSRTTFKPRSAPDSAFRTPVLLKVPDFSLTRRRRNLFGTCISFTRLLYSESFK